LFQAESKKRAAALLRRGGDGVLRELAYVHLVKQCSVEIQYPGTILA